MRWLLIVVMLGVLVACGGDADDADTATDTGSTYNVASTDSGSSDAAATAEQDTAREDDDDNGSSDGVILTGDIEDKVTIAGSCGDGVVGDDLQYVASGVNGDGNLFMLQIYINAFEGAGEYDVTDPGSSYDANVTYSDGVGGSWLSSSEMGGTVVVEANGQSGSIEAMLENMANDGQTATISGSWVCEAS